MDEKIVELKNFLKDGKDRMQQKIDELVSDNRQDEARVYRASLNIYDIMGTLLDTAKKIAEGDVNRMKEEFHRLATRVPASWKVSLEKAKEHDDFEKIMMEEAKLNVADSVIRRFDELF